MSFSLCLSLSLSPDLPGSFDIPYILVFVGNNNDIITKGSKQRVTVLSRCTDIYGLFADIYGSFDIPCIFVCVSNNNDIITRGSKLGLTLLSRCADIYGLFADIYGSFVSNNNDIITRGSKLSERLRRVTVLSRCTDIHGLFADIYSSFADLPALLQIVQGSFADILNLRAGTQGRATDGGGSPCCQDAWICTAYLRIYTALLQTY